MRGYLAALVLVSMVAASVYVYRWANTGPAVAEPTAPTESRLEPVVPGRLLSPIITAGGGISCEYDAWVKIRAGAVTEVTEVATRVAHGPAVGEILPGVGAVVESGIPVYMTADGEFAPGCAPESRRFPDPPVPTPPYADPATQD